ncbi:MAG: uncharacterized protein H6Q38_3184 [Chloroflexi bacterium]|nr:uncharacterized protein [Chloroflexota bacterium]
MVTGQRIVILLLALSLLAGAITGRELYYRLSYLWGLLLVLSWLMSFLALRGVQMKRTSRTLRSQVGQIFEERYEILNTGRLPRLWLEVRDESSLPGASGSHVMTLIGGRESRSYLARTWLRERGVFPLGPTVLASGDLFGLFPTDRTVPYQESLLVYPLIVDVRSFPNPPGLLPGGEHLRRRTPQITSNASGVREYGPGDPLNRIHWLSTARRNRLMVKEFELDPLAEVWIFTDASKSVQAEKPEDAPEFDPKDVLRKRTKFELPPSTLEYGVSIAASLARYYLQRGRAVGLVYASHTVHILPSDRGARQLAKILESLALLKAEGNLPLQSLVEAQARHLPRGSTAVLITPSASETVFHTADVLLRRGLRPVVVLLDATTFGGYFSSERLASSLDFLGVPVCQIAYGDDLSAALSATVSRPTWA